MNSKYAQTNGGSLPSFTGFRLHFHIRSTCYTSRPEKEKSPVWLDKTSPEKRAAAASLPSSASSPPAQPLRRGSGQPQALPLTAGPSVTKGDPRLFWYPLGKEVSGNISPGFNFCQSVSSRWGLKKNLLQHKNRHGSDMLRLCTVINDWVILTQWVTFCELG